MAGKTEQKDSMSKAQVTIPLDIPDVTQRPIVFAVSTNVSTSQEFFFKLFGLISDKKVGFLGCLSLFFLGCFLPAATNRYCVSQRQFALRPVLRYPFLKEVQCLLTPLLELFACALLILISCRKTTNLTLLCQSSIIHSSYARFVFGWQNPCA